ncbi:protein trapped in endoderm-1-like [Paramacrobiotus metropolitanus]|uniref:protein trapped in endoderm-1-like n=1 Tax=Paramacrobiotus metropolitanus TaxID=2943436 RepID=UPI0024461549|nr:protein trapped in endoderm-1-like [Paramacrobiotus metropolitanus]
MDSSSFRNISNNQTLQLSVDWNYAAVGRTTLCILQLLLNFSMLLVIIRQQTLRTAFSVYIIGLLSANIFYAACEYPLEILLALYSEWWMSRAACSFYLYQIWVFVAVPMHMHVLITINRLWALTFPLSYRNIHSSKVAGLLCIGNVVYVHILCFPLFLIDELYYRVPLERFGCSLDTVNLNVYANVVNMMAFNMPIIIVVCSYPFILHKHLQRRKVWAVNKTDRTGVYDKHDNPISTHHRRGTESVANKHTAENVRPFLVLSMLTCSVFICWTPDQVYWTLDNFVDTSGFVWLHHVGMVLYGLQAVLDPILFAVSLSSFRTTIKQLWSQWF